MKRINSIKFFEITASLVMILIISISCNNEQEKKTSKSEPNFEIESITNVSSINLKIKSAINQFIEKSNDSVLVEMFSEIEKKHNQVDTILNFVAQKKLIVLTDTFSKKTHAFETSTENGLNDLKIFLEKEKDKLEKIRHENKVSELNKFYEIKVNELEQNINTINNFLETQNKTNN